MLSGRFIKITVVYLKLFEILDKGQTSLGNFTSSKQRAKSLSKSEDISLEVIVKKLHCPFRALVYRFGDIVRCPVIYFTFPKRQTQ